MPCIYHSLSVGWIPPLVQNTISARPVLSERLLLVPIVIVRYLVEAVAGFLCQL